MHQTYNGMLRIVSSNTHATPHIAKRATDVMHGTYTHATPCMVTHATDVMHGTYTHDTPHIAARATDAMRSTCDAMHGTYDAMRSTYGRPWHAMRAMAVPWHAMTLHLMLRLMQCAAHADTRRAQVRHLRQRHRIMIMIIK